MIVTDENEMHMYERVYKHGERREKSEKEKEIEKILR